MGWIKGVNSNTLDNTRDPGNDSKYGETSGNGSYRTIAPNLHQYVASDAASYSLHYFNGDYTPIETQTTAGNFIADMSSISNAGTYGPDLFNGNISRMVTTITDPNPANPTPLPQVMFYQYDQLNRIKTARAYSAINLSTNTWNAGAIAAQGDYYNAFTYDANGNILTQQRNGIASVAQVEDNLTYNYKTRANGNITSHLTNQLKQVAEDASLADCSYGDDINKGQATDNYQYDAIGNLVIDKQQYIYGSNNPAVAGIEWTSFGKIKSITKDNSTGKYVDCNGNSTQDGGEATLVLQDIVFKYNSDGQRVCKIVKPHNPAGGVLGQVDWIYTYYLRDAQGNVLATYERKQVSSVDKFNLKEQDLYGSSRLGMVQRTLDMLTAGAPGNPVKRTVGEKVYEISNHLGNVLTMISDRRIAVDANTNGVVDWFKPVIVSATDYAAFGSALAGRSYYSTTYSYGFNGKENDAETGTQDYGFRIYNPSLGRFLSVDPITAKYPMLTPYQFASNSPIWMIDLDGLEGVIPGHTVVFGATASAMLGIISPSVGEKKSCGLAIDSYGNFALTGSMSQFLDFFGNSLPNYGVDPGHTGVQNKQWTFGASVALSLDFGVYQYDHVKELSGQTTSFDLDVGLFGYAGYSVTYNKQTGSFEGLTGSLGIGEGGSFGMNTNETSVLAFSPSDIARGVLVAGIATNTYRNLVMSNPIDGDNIYTLAGSWSTDANGITSLTYSIYENRNYIDVDGHVSISSTKVFEMTALEMYQPDPVNLPNYWTTTLFKDAEPKD